MIHLYFHSWAAFWQMGKYGAYVWSAYGMGFVLIFIALLDAWRLKRKARKLCQISAVLVQKNQVKLQKVRRDHASS